MSNTQPSSRFSSLATFTETQETFDPKINWPKMEAIGACQEQCFTENKGTLDSCRVACIDAMAETTLSGKDVPKAVRCEGDSFAVHRRLEKTLEGYEIQYNLQCKEKSFQACTDYCVKEVAGEQSPFLKTTCQVECDRAIIDKLMDAAETSSKIGVLEPKTCMDDSVFNDNPEIQQWKSDTPVCNANSSALSYQVQLTMAESPSTPTVIGAALAATRAITRTVAPGLVLYSSVYFSVSHVSHAFQKETSRLQKVQDVALATISGAVAVGTVMTFGTTALIPASILGGVVLIKNLF